MLENLAGKASRARRRLALAKEQAGHAGAAKEIVRLARRAVVIPVSAARDVAFDWRMGVRTRGEVSHESELIPRSIGGDPRFYQPIYLGQWRRALATIPVDRRTATFVDLGAGRGRALILAAEMGFGRVVGVELDERLTDEAAENIRRWRRRRGSPPGSEQDVAAVHGDAAAYQFPAGRLVILLYNPFGATTMRHVLREVSDLERASDDQVYVAYFNPVHESVFAEFPRLVPHARGKGWSVYRLDPGGPATR